MRRATPIAVYAVTAIMLWPILWMVMTSFKPPIEFVSQSISILPKEPTLEHYRQLVEDEIVDQVTNSLLVTLGAATLSLLVAFPAAYALVRLRLPRRMDAAFLVFVLLVKLAPPWCWRFRCIRCCAPFTCSTPLQG